MATAWTASTCSVVKEDQNSSRLCVHHPTAIQVIDHGEVMVTTGKRLLIHAQPEDRLGLAPLQAAFHRPLLDGVHFIPTQVQPVGYRLLACGAKPVDSQSFE